MVQEKYGEGKLYRSCEKISFTKRVKEERNILQTKTRKANWIGHILRINCLLKRVIEGKIEGSIEVTGRQGRRRKQLLDGLRERSGYWKLKEDALDRTFCRTCLGRRLCTCPKTMQNYARGTKSPSLSVTSYL